MTKTFKNDKIKTRPINKKLSKMRKKIKSKMSIIKKKDYLIDIAILPNPSSIFPMGGGFNLFRTRRKTNMKNQYKKTYKKNIKVKNCNTTKC